MQNKQLDSPTLGFKELVFAEEEQFFVVNKPHGLLTHRNNDRQDEKSLVDCLRPVLSTFPESDLRAGLAHRLDRDTGGLLLLAKNPKSLDILQTLFRERLIKKKYVALVYGRVRKGEEEIVNFLSREKRRRNRRVVLEFDAHGEESEKENTEKPDVSSKKNYLNDPSENLLAFRQKEASGSSSKLALTRYEVVALFEKTSFLDVEIETGRTHQIRVQLANLGHPVVGDRLYSKRFSSESHLFLFAYHLAFPNIFAGGEEISYTSPLPGFFLQRLAELRKEFE